MTSNITTSAGRVALITGASRGIGRATALEFARRGGAVTLLARSTDEAPSRVPGTIDAVAREIDAVGGRVLAVAADVRMEYEVRTAVERTLAAFGRIDVLVNNAAYFHSAPFYKMPLGRWDLTLDVNLRGAVICTQAVLPAMIEQGRGRVINISSGAAAQYYEGMSAYAGSKAGLEMVTRYLATELAQDGIAANALRIDSAVATEGARFLNPAADFEGWATSEDAARAVLWLAEQQVSYTGNMVLMSDLIADRSTNG